MSDPQKLQMTPEQLKQLVALQHGLSKQKISKARGVFHKYFSGFIAQLQKYVMYLDLFVNFILKKECDDRNDVLQAARAPIIFGTYVIIIFVIFGGLWSAIAPLNSAAIAIGIVVPHSNKKSIAHQEGGIIKNIFIKQGDRVSEGDKLFELEDTRVKSQYEDALHQYRTALATESRLVAERDDQDAVIFPEFLIHDIHVPEVHKMISTQENLFRSRKELYRAEKESLKQKILQLHKQIEGLNAKKTSLIKTAEVIDDRLKAARVLLSKNFIQKASVLELEMKAANVSSDIAGTDAEVARTNQEITKSDIEIVNLQNKFTGQTLAELKETQVRVASLREQFLALSDALERVVIKSPVDGIVNLLNYHTIGGVVRSGDTILEISPLNDALVIEAKVSHKNIDVVHVGLTAKIRFSAFKSRTTPLFTGKVVSLSPDIVQDRNMQMPQGEGVYIARIEVDMNEFNKIATPLNLQLHPGMQAEVQIVTGTRTLLQYLLSPVTDVMFRAFREK